MPVRRGCSGRSALPRVFERPFLASLYGLVVSAAARPVVSHHDVNRLARTTLWMRLDFRLRGNDAVWYDEELFL